MPNCNFAAGIGGWSASDSELKRGPSVTHSWDDLEGSAMLGADEILCSLATDASAVDPGVGGYLQSGPASPEPVPAGTQSLLVELRCTCATPGAIFNVDDVFLGVDLLPVEIQSFSIE